MCVCVSSELRTKLLDTKMLIEEGLEASVGRICTLYNGFIYSQVLHLSYSHCTSHIEHKCSVQYMQEVCYVLCMYCISSNDWN